MSDPPELSPREAADRWLDRASLDRAAQTIAGYRGQLKHFVRWCESNEITAISDLRPWDIEQFEIHRRGEGLKKITLRNELGTLRQLLEYCCRVGIADDELADSIELPTTTPDEETDETILKPDRAERLLSAYRDGSEEWPRGHAYLELAWFTGARLGGLRALDLRDVDLERGFVHFQHRPESDTPLKNAKDGERVVGISEAVIQALRTYIARDRPKVDDDHGRTPLFTTRQGRMSLNAMRTTSYYATICDRGQSRDSCEFSTQPEASQCSASRSPHQLRSGSITWQLDRGIRADVVAERVNASVEIIEQHYDQASDLDAFEKRRKNHISKLGFTDPNTKNKEDSE